MVYNYNAHSDCFARAHFDYAVRVILHLALLFDSVFKRRNIFLSPHGSFLDAHF